MAYKNFIPEVWEQKIQTELTRDHVFATDCNQNYTGQVEKLGDAVRILGVGKPTITSVDKDTFTGLSTPETLGDTSILMPIDRMSHFNVQVGDIDKLQAVNGLMEVIRSEASEGIADEQDKFIAELATDSLAVRYNSSVTQFTKANILTQIDGALQKLYENDVKKSTKIVIDMNPAVYTLFKQAYMDLDTDNSELVANGAVAKYAGAYIKLSNNVKQTTESSHTVNNIMVRTQRAVAFACPKIHVEPYRLEAGFADALKGFALYGAKIVRPKEMIILNGYV